jgi:hypothetical protein
MPLLPHFPFSASRLPCSQSSHSDGGLFVGLENIWPKTCHFHLLLPALASQSVKLTMLFLVAVPQILVTRFSHVKLYCRSLNWALSEMISTCVVTLEASSLIHSRLSLSFLKHDAQKRSQFSRYHQLQQALLFCLCVWH